MHYYFAPMEGVTDWVYRRVHHKYFSGVERYYTPFLSPGSQHKNTAKDNREIPLADTLDFSVVPQILTKHSEDFIWLAQKCRDLGYEEVNLNLGCPSGTVTAKKKGSGMLQDPDAVDALLYEIFSQQAADISVKTRIGFHDAENFPEILQIYNRYPIKELIIHPRVRDDFYKGNLHMDVFSYAVQNSRNPICFNGNLCSKADISRFCEAFPQIQALMLGRGLIGNPGMLTVQGTSAQKLEDFTDELLEEYTREFGSARNAMFRMKENWRYLFRLFEHPEKLHKQLRKTTDIAQYKALTHQIFRELPLRADLDPDW